VVDAPCFEACLVSMSLLLQGLGLQRSFITFRKVLGTISSNFVLAMDIALLSLTCAISSF